jgi:hypothetical protein
MEESEMCVICGRTSKEANLISAVLYREKQIMKVCEKCVLIEDVVIIPKPTKTQLQEAEIPYTVYERLAKMSGVKGKQESSKKVKSENMTLSLLQSAKQPNTEKREVKKEDIKILETKEGKSAIIDFSSKNLKIGDLQKLRKKVLE